MMSETRSCICGHCGHSGQFLTDSQMAWCPTCYRGTPIHLARIRHPQPPHGRGDDSLQAIKDLFGFR